MNRLSPYYRKLQEEFANYLKQKGESSIPTTKSDAFYLCRNYDSIDFMELLTSNSFEQLAHKYLAMSGAPKSSLNSYMSSIRKLRKFVLENNPDDMNSSDTYDMIYSTKNKNIPYPTCNIVNRYLDKWASSADLFKPESVLKNLFTNICPYNHSIDDIILKAAVLNTVYNTRITSIYPIAQHIHSLNIDNRLKIGDDTLVNELMSVDYVFNGETKHTNYYSFASKYCSFHNPDAYPIYDSYIDSVLWYYQKAEHFFTFKRSDLKNYNTFKCVIRAFQIHFGLEQYTFKQLDQYLWLFGKEYF